MYTDINLQPIYDDQPYISSDGTQYPANFPKGEILGLIPVIEVTPPTDPSLIVTGFIIDENFNQVWETRPKLELDIQNEIIPLARTALLHTDLVAIRCMKAGIAFPIEWQLYVLDLRDIINGLSLVLPTKPEYPANT